MHFEIRRLSETSGTTGDATIVDASGVKQFLREAAENGERLYIRPAER